MSATVAPAGSASEAFAAVGNPLGMLLLTLVSAEEDLHLEALAREAELAHQVASRRLAALKRAGLVTTVRAGGLTGYRLTRRGRTVLLCAARLEGG